MADPFVPRCGYAPGGTAELKMASEFVKLEFYVPETHLEPVRQAVCQAGGGRLGGYDNCCCENSKKQDDSACFHT